MIICRWFEKDKRTVPLSFVLIMLFMALFSVRVFAATGKYASDETVIGCGTLGGDGTYDYYAYRLRDSETNGAALKNTNRPIHFEAGYGLRVTCEGTMVNCEFYSHYTRDIKGHVYVKQLEKVFPKTKTERIDLGEVSRNKTISFDMKDVEKKLNIKGLSGSGGLVQKREQIDEHGYRLIPADREMEIFEVEFVPSEEKKLSPLTYLYHDGGDKVKTCLISTSREIEQDIAKWNQVIGSCNPDKCLDMYVGNKNYPITYPTSGTDGNCNHVSLWQKKSDELLGKFDYWTDEMKVFFLADYLVDHYAYDDWRVRRNNNKSRATKYGRWNDDSLWMYYNKVGQCWDFANVMTIMCRQQGIPCTSVDSRRHAANAVWLNNEWVCIDITDLLKYHNNEEDPLPEDSWIASGDYGWYYYGSYSSHFDTYNQSLCTPTTATIVNGKNPM